MRSLLSNIIGFLFVISYIAISQTDSIDDNSNSRFEKSTFGLFAGANYYWHDTNIPLIDFADDCGNYSNSNSVGYNLGMTVDYPILKNWIILSGRLLYSYIPMTLENERADFEVYNPSTESYEKLVRQFEYDAKLQYIFVNIGVKSYPFSPIPSYIRLGIEAGNPFISADYVNKERIISPDYILYPTEKKEHTISKGDINNINTFLGIQFGIGYDYELKSGIIISPEISYKYGINDIYSGDKWKINTISINLTAKLTPKTRSSFDKSYSDIEYDEDEMDTQFEAKPIQLRKTVVTQTYPLLPMIFFDEKSSNIKKDYITTYNNDFSEAELPHNTLDIYYNILNIIGSRANENTIENIVLTGTSDGKEFTEKSKRLAIAEDRANEISDYLHKKWNIDKEKIIVKWRDIPEKPTNIVYDEASEENRRVEIQTSDQMLLDPIIKEKFDEYSLITTNNLILSKVNKNKEIDKWKIQYYVNDKVILTDRGKGGIPENIFVNIQNMNSKDINTLSEDDLTAAISIKYNDGTIDEKTFSVPINILDDDHEVARLNLIVFDFDSYELSKENKTMIKEFAKSSIKPISTVRIIGSTDRLGSKEYNKELSEKRAETVRDALLQGNPEANIIEVKGIGSSNLLLDNNLPEGRYYSRTVMIEVLTPLE